MPYLLDTDFNAFVADLNNAASLASEADKDQIGNVQTSSEFGLTYVDNETVVQGSGFVYGPNGLPVDGTVTGFANGGTAGAFGVIGLDIPVTTLLGESGAGIKYAPVLLSGDTTYDLRGLPYPQGSSLIGYGGDDTFLLANPADVTIDGGAGQNVVAYTQLRDQVALAVGATATTASYNSETDSITSVQSIRFLDGTSWIGSASPGGQAYAEYDVALGRAPDASTLGFWGGDVSAYGAGAVAGGLLGTAEGQAVYGRLSDADFVGAVYRNALGRAAEAGGVGYWTGLLAAGVSRGDVLAGIATSAEADARFAPAVSGGVFGVAPIALAAEQLEVVANNAVPSGFGLAEDINELQGTTTLHDFASGLADAVFGRLSDSDFVNNLQRNTYGSADPAATAYYVGQLQAGVGDRGDVLLAYAFSPGGEAKVAPDITAGGLLHG